MDDANAAVLFAQLLVLMGVILVWSIEVHCGSRCPRCRAATARGKEESDR